MCAKFDYILTEEYEREVRKEFEPLVKQQIGAREVGMNGNYLPGGGIYSVGWNGWKEFPAADFVEKLTTWHNGFVRDHREDPFYPFMSPLVYQGELNLRELRTNFEHMSGIANLAFYYEGIAHFRAHLAGLREIRDFLAWHLFEETGHNEMLADFMEGYFKMDRVKEIWPLTDTLLLMEKDRMRYERLQRFKALNATGHFVEIAAAAMFRERILPKGNRLNALGLRKHYNVPNKYLTFFDVHRFIDIYHERFGQYLLAKYATTKGLQDQAEKVFKEMVLREYQSEEKLYATMRASKK